MYIFLLFLSPVGLIGPKGLFCKETDSHSYLLFSSAHPSSCISSIPYSQLLRVRRICTRTQDFVRNSKELIFHFAQRGYPLQLLIDTFNKVLSLDRDTLLVKQTIPVPDTQTPVEKKMIFTTTFHPVVSPRIPPIIKENQPLLLAVKDTMPLATGQVIFGHRRNKNLRQHLVQSRFTSTRIAPRSDYSCTTVNCRYCLKINLSGRIKSKVTGKSYTTIRNTDCRKNNLVYCLQCNGCGKQYVGQCKRPIFKRWTEHFAHIIHVHREIPIGFHFNQPDHKGIDDLEIFVLQYSFLHPDSAASLAQRKQMERTWIHKLGTVVPGGLNSMAKGWNSTLSTEFWNISLPRSFFIFLLVLFWNSFAPLPPGRWKFFLSYVLGPSTYRLRELFQAQKIIFLIPDEANDSRNHLLAHPRKTQGPPLSPLRGRVADYSGSPSTPPSFLNGGLVTGVSLSSLPKSAYWFPGWVATPAGEKLYTPAGPRVLVPDLIRVT